MCTPGTEFNIATLEPEVVTGMEGNEVVMLFRRNRPVFQPSKTRQRSSESLHYLAPNLTYKYFRF